MRSRNWSRMAERHNAAAEARAPLLASAGLIRPLGAEDIQASYERWHREREQHRLRQARFAERCRHLVARHVSSARIGPVGRTPLSTTPLERVLRGFLAWGPGAVVWAPGLGVGPAARSLFDGSSDTFFGEVV